MRQAPHWLGRLAGVVVAGALSAAQAAQVRLVIVDSDTGASVPCRVHLKDAEGKPVRGRGLPFWHDHFVCPGLAEVDLPRGAYRFEIERGPEYLVTRGELEAGEAPSVTVTNRLRRMVDLAQEGWWSGELHVHRPPADLPLLMRAEDLHVAPVITWWNTQNLWRNRALPPDPLVEFDTNRFYQLMGGEDERGGGALLYFGLAQPLEISGAQREYPSPMKYLVAAHQQPSVWVDLEKPFWYDAPVWLASGLVDSVGIAHNHMHRGGVYPNEAWGRPRDARRLPDPQGNGIWTQEIYYHILNCGLRMPPSAGSASGVLPNPVGYDRAYVHLEGELTYEKWWACLKAGRVFVSNGPLLRCRANGELPGHIFQAAAGAPLNLRLDAALDSRDPIARVEIIQNGRVVRTLAGSEFKSSGSLGRITFTESGWFLVRAIADVPYTFRFASTGPFYVEIGSAPRRISRASAQFFVDWVREREELIKLADPKQWDEVLGYQRDAEKFWRAKLAQANAD